MPFIKYPEKAKILFLIFWSYAAVIFCVSMIVVFHRELKTNQKEIDEYKKDKVVYIVGRFGALLYFVSMFCLIFLARNNYVNISLFSMIGIAVLGLLLFAVIITLLTQYKNNYVKMAKDTINFLLAFFVVILFSILMLAGIFAHGNENFPKYFSEFLVGISAIPLLLGGIYLVCKMFLSSKMMNDKSDGLPISIVLFIAIGIVTCILLRYAITDDKMQEIMTTIFAAILGGAITLAGVAWTIKDANTKRQQDLERIEKERKEDERKKYRPFVNFWVGPFEGKKYDILTDNFLVNTDKVSNQQTELLSNPNYIVDAYFSNTDFSDFYVWGMRLDNQGIGFDSIRFVKKGSSFVLNFSKKPLYTEKPIEAMSIILEDMLENLYELPLKFEFDESTNTYTIVGNDPSLLLNYTDMENNDEQNNVRKGISTVHNQSTNKRKWLY